MAQAGMSSSVERWVLKKLYAAAGRPPVAMALQGGPEVGPAEAAPVAKLVIRDRATLLRIVLDPELAFGEAYAEGSVEVEGDLLALLDAVYHSMFSQEKRAWYPRLASLWLQLTQGNSRRGSRHNIHHHYDIGNQFYQLWLDHNLLYTCAYFPEPAATLEEAQVAKMDHVCRKVRLQPGERIVEAGCGWGGLALHMARQYGVKVKAFNISHEQIVYARWRARQEALDGSVEFIEDDYRNIHGRFDALISVGMLEHVGREHYRELGRVIHRTVGDSGRGLLHFIGRSRPRPLNAWLRKHIFPGAYPPTLREMMEMFEPWNFTVLDVENLRLHYARTLEHWLERFERSRQQVAALFDDRFVRMWRLYLAGSAAAFHTGTMQLFQVVFAGSECKAIPWTRAYMYEPQEERRDRLQAAD
ncbi:MAG TPA: cyclopropane-fatty-acyl-phospholipid synthase family protein [Terriglobales bacterium]|nr:cyclopropane-fatty-acyl-phospholipid synthase family protein [Terriglobales bacterium]